MGSFGIVLMCLMLLIVIVVLVAIICSIYRASHVKGLHHR